MMYAGCVPHLVGMAPRIPSCAMQAKSEWCQCPAYAASHQQDHVSCVTTRTCQCATSSEHAPRWQGYCRLVHTLHAAGAFVATPQCHTVGSQHKAQLEHSMQYCRLKVQHDANGMLPRIICGALLSLQMSTTLTMSCSAQSLQ